MVPTIYNASLIVSSSITDMKISTTTTTQTWFGRSGAVRRSFVGSHGVSSCAAGLVWSSTTFVVSGVGLGDLLRFCHRTTIRQSSGSVVFVVGSVIPGAMILPLYIVVCVAGCVLPKGL